MNIDVSLVLVVVAAMVYLNMNARNNYLGYAWVMNIGLVLMLFGASLDFMDSMPGYGCSNWPLHDFLEDQVGYTLGLAIFIFGVFREIFE